MFQALALTNTCTLTVLDATVRSTTIRTRMFPRDCRHRHGFSKLTYELNVHEVRPQHLVRKLTRRIQLN